VYRYHCALTRTGTRLTYRVLSIACIVRGRPLVALVTGLSDLPWSLHIRWCTGACATGARAGSDSGAMARLVTVISAGSQLAGLREQVPVQCPFNGGPVPTCNTLPTTRLPSTTHRQSECRATTAHRPPSRNVRDIVSGWWRSSPSRPTDCGTGQRK
jgi:hypothetical protein